MWERCGSAVGGMRRGFFYWREGTRVEKRIFGWEAEMDVGTMLEGAIKNAVTYYSYHWQRRPCWRCEW